MASEAETLCRLGVCSGKRHHYAPARIPLAVLFRGDSSSFMKKTPLLPVLVALAAAPLCHAAEKPAKPVVAVYDLEGVLSGSGQVMPSMLDLTFDASLIDEMIPAKRADAGTADLLRSFKHTGLLEALPAPTRAALSRAISRIEAFSETRVLLLGPGINLN